MTLPNLLHATPLLMGIVLPGTLIGLGSLALGRTLPRLNRHVPTLPLPSGEIDIRHARAILDQQADTAAFMALLGDKQLLFSESGRSFLMVGRTPTALVTHGASFGDPAERTALIDRALAIAKQEQRIPLFSMVLHQDADVLRDRSLIVHKLGDEALIPLNPDTLRGPGARNLRNTRKRLERAGCSFEWVDADAAPAHYHEVKELSERWLQQHNTPELRFSLGQLSQEYLKRHPLAIVRFKGKAVAFANVLRLPGAGRFTLDLMRFDPDAPNGIVDFLVVNLIEWGVDAGYRTFNLGLSPLSGLGNRPGGPIRWGQRFLFEHGEALYPFQGIYRFKRKFHPDWQPRYLATAPGLKGARALLEYLLLIRS